MALHEPHHLTPQQLTAFALDQIAADELTQIAAHLDECAACCQRLDELLAQGGLLARLRTAADRGVWEGEDERRRAAQALRYASPAASAASRTLVIPAAAPPTSNSTQDREALTRAAGTPDPRLGSTPRLPGYELLEELGRGGMGVVYKARHVELNRIVALKLLRDPLADPNTLARSQDEAKAVARLQHPGIVQIFETGTLEGQPYLALEYVSGPSLAQVLAGNPQPPREAAAFLIPLAEAIDAAHRQGILHRDLKPANVLLEMKNAKRKVFSAEPDASTSDTYHLSLFTPKITDFGLAKPLDEDLGRTVTGMVVGTPCYMAPEQAEGGKTLGPAADLYSLGVILYEMLTGRPPLQGATAYETIRQVVGEEPVPPTRLQPATPRDLETISLKCLHKDPRRRYASAVELAGDLRHFLEGRPILARPVGLAERTVKWARRRPAIATLLSGMVLALIGLTAAVFQLWDMNAQLTQAKEQETRLRETAQANEARAIKNFTMAKDAVDGLYLLTAETPQFQDDALLEARKLLLSKALPFYRDFQTQSAAVNLQEVSARNQARIGDINHVLGRMVEAETAYREALRQWQGLTDSQPEALAYRLELSRTWCGLGNTQTALDHHAAAQESYDRAMRTLDLLEEKALLTIPAQHALATAYRQMGWLFSRQGWWKEGVEANTEAAAIWEKLAARQPDHPAYRHEAARAWALASMMSHRSDQPGPALAAGEKARQLLEALVEAHPAVTQYRHDLANTWHHVAMAHQALGSHEPAWNAFVQALRWQRPLATVHPHLVSYQRALAETMSHFGNLQRDMGHPTMAVPTFRETLALQEKLAAVPNALPADHYALAATFFSLARAHDLQDQKAEARQAYLHTVAKLEALVKNSPGVQQYEHVLGVTYHNLAHLLRRQEAPAEALVWHAKAGALMERRYVQWPEDAGLALLLRNTHWVWAQTLEDLHRHAEALPHWLRAATLNPEPQQREYFQEQVRPCLQRMLLQLLGPGIR